MDVNKLFDTTSPSTKDRKVFKYPFLFDVNLDGSGSENTWEWLTTWECDMVLECLQPLSCEVFRNAFRYTLREEPTERIEYPETTYTPSIPYERLKTLVEPLHEIQEYCSVPSLDSLEWTTPKEGIQDLNNEMRKLFHSDYVVAGNAFTDSVLKFGSIGNYYLQYLANGLFGHPNAIMAIQNRRHLLNCFTQNETPMLHDETRIQRLVNQLYLAFVEVAPERWQESSGQFPFEKGDIMECMVTIRGHVDMSTKLSLIQHVEIQTFMKQLFYSSTICDDEGNLYPQTWKLRFVLL